MQKPGVVLNNLTKQTQNKDYKFKKLYKFLYNEEFYMRAYGNIYAKEGNMTPGADGKTIDGFSMIKVQKIIQELRDFTYQPKPVRRVYIEKKGSSKKRPLGIPSIEDKLLQEVIKELLQSIYEPCFSESSHGFRPKRSCHTVLSSIKTSCTGMKWWIEGDIEGYFDNINHHVLIEILREKISDEKFINLIWKFLRAGYMENWSYNKTYSGTPQGGIMSPILANIYLDKLDKFMDEYIKGFNCGVKRRDYKEYKNHLGYIYKLKKRITPIWDTLSQEKKDEYLSKIKDRQKIIRTLPSRDPYDPNFKRVKYFRYADDFILGVIGSKEDAKLIKEDIKSFLDEKLKLTLSDKKTKIRNAAEKARFLGYDIYVAKTDSYKKLKAGFTSRSISGHVMLSMPYDKMRDFLFGNEYIKERINKGRGNTWESKSRAKLTICDNLEIVEIYNAELRGFYNYYQLAYDVYRIGNIYNLMYFSCLKTIAHKYKTSTQKILANKVKGQTFMKNNKFGVFYNTEEGLKFREFIRNEFGVNKEKIEYISHDNIPNTIQYSNSRTGLEQRLSAGVCEWCGSNKDIEVHHVRKIKDLKGKKRWEQLMIARKRKTMVLCHNCHWDLHLGKLD